MKNRKIEMTILLTSMVIVTLACNLSSAIVKQVPTIAVPTMAPAEQQALTDQMANTLNQAASGQQVTLELTESQLTGLINGQTGNIKDAQLSNLQVVLDNNQATITGSAATNGFSGNLSIVLTVGTSADGKPQMNVASATIAGFPIPEAALTTLSTTINEGLQGQTGQGFTIESLSIADHKLIIIARKM
jgi:uncharacterized protein YpmS